MPDIFAALCLPRDNRGAKQVVTFAHRPVIIGPAITSREVDQTELRVERRGIPYWRAASHCDQFRKAKYRRRPLLDLGAYTNATESLRCWPRAPSDGCCV